VIGLQFLAQSRTVRQAIKDKVGKELSEDDKIEGFYGVPLRKHFSMASESSYVLPLQEASIRSVLINCHRKFG
jgi:hypothetical protein